MDIDVSGQGQEHQQQQQEGGAAAAADNADGDFPSPGESTTPRTAKWPTAMQVDPAADDKQQEQKLLSPQQQHQQDTDRQALVPHTAQNLACPTLAPTGQQPPAGPLRLVLATDEFEDSDGEEERLRNSTDATAAAAAALGPEAEYAFFSTRVYSAGKGAALWRSGRERGVWLRELRRAALCGTVAAAALAGQLLVDRCTPLVKVSGPAGGPAGARSVPVGGRRVSVHAEACDRRGLWGVGCRYLVTAG